MAELNEEAAGHLIATYIIVDDDSMDLRVPATPQITRTAQFSRNPGWAITPK